MSVCVGVVCMCVCLYAIHFLNIATNFSIATDHGIESGSLSGFWCIINGNKSKREDMFDASLKFGHDSKIRKK